jgi:TRAP-type C4-dicarboxylate transport system substrate-binding protein
MKILSASTVGRRDIFSNQPIDSIEDIQGLKIRVIANPVHVDAFNYMGLKATPLPYGEVYNSLRLKMIDAAENSPNAYIEMRFVEAAPYYLQIDHLSNGIAVFMSHKAWDSLPGSYQRIIQQCAVSAMNASSLWGLGASDYYLEGEVNESVRKMVIATPEEKHALREKVLPKLLDKYSEAIGQDILEFLAEKDEVIANWLGNNIKNDY